MESEPVRTAMPAAIPEEKIAQMLALYDAGAKKGEARKKAGIGKTAAAAIFRERRPDHPNPSELHAERLQQAEEIAQAAREGAVDDLKEEFRQIVALATERIKEGLQEGADPNPTQTTSAWKALDKLVSSADARENAKAAEMGADKYTAVLERLTASDDEIADRMQAIEEAQDEVVAMRQPYIVNPPDSASA